MIKFSLAVIGALSALVMTLDSHPIGAACLVALLLAGGFGVVLAAYSKRTKHGQ